MSRDSQHKPETLAAQALGWVEAETRALVPPIHPSASYERDAQGNYPGGHTYTRDQNPTYDRAEALIAKLEGAHEALLFASGMAAATTLLDTLQTGDHLIAPKFMYWTIRSWIAKLPERRGVAVDFVDNGDLDALERALKPGKTKLVWVETPANPTCAITDLERTCELCHDKGAKVVADSTVATPVLTRPLEFGVDYVMHSATKQLNGHSDVLAGVLVTKADDEVWQQCRYERAYRGAVLGPFETWLLLRGLRTLYVRVRASAAAAQHVAEALSERPEVTSVMYPGLPSHPGHELAKRQMQWGFGSMLSFRLAGGESAARAVVGGLRLFKNATSLGSVESLAEHRAPIEGPDSPVPTDLVRLSVGLESADDLVADLYQSLDANG